MSSRESQELSCNLLLTEHKASTTQPKTKQQSRDVQLLPGVFFNLPTNPLTLLRLVFICAFICCKRIIAFPHVLMMLHSSKVSTSCFCPGHTSQSHKKVILSVNHPEELITGDIQYDRDVH